MRGINIFESCHVVNCLPPVDITGGKLSQAWSMKNFRAANILFEIGVSAAAFTKILVFACDDAAKANAVAIPFVIYKEETAAGDTLDARVDVTAAGYTPSANDNIFYGIYVDAQALASSGKGYMYVQATNGANSVIAACQVILTGAGYAGAGLSLTAIT